jgi:Zn-dependent protease with chaperone function
MFEQQLSVEEKEFVLAHEYSHIIMNDSPLLLMGNVASSIVNDYIREIKDKTAKMVLEIAWFYIQTRASLVFGKQSELKADAHAVHVTNNKAAAVAMIERLGV